MNILSIVITASVLIFSDSSYACTATTYSSRDSIIQNFRTFCQTSCTQMGSQCVNNFLTTSPRVTPGAGGDLTIFVEVLCNIKAPSNSGPGYMTYVYSQTEYAACATNFPAAAPSSAMQTITASNSGKASVSSIDACPSAGGSSETSKGSIINVDFQSLAEEIPLVGVPFNLIYSTDLVKDRAGFFQVNIPVTQATYSTNATLFNLKIYNEANQIVVDQNFSPASFISYTYFWNGNYANGVPATVPLKHKYTITESNSVAGNIPISYDLNMGTFQALNLDLGHFLPEMYSFYDAQTGRLFYASGGVRSIVATLNTTTNLYSIAEADGSALNEYFANGLLKKIRTSLTGQILYEFFYDGNGRLSSVQDAYGRSTIFNRDSNGVWTSISTPYGKTISILLDGYDRLTRVTQPSTDYYEMTYKGTSGLIETFRKPNGAISTFQYNSFGNLTEDSHSGGFVQNLVSLINSAYQKQVSYSQSGKSSNKVSTNYFLNQTRTVTDTSAPTKEVTYKKDFEKIVNAGFSSETTYGNHPQFGAQASVITSFKGGEFGLYRTLTYQNTFSRSNPNDPFSITAWVKKVTLNGQMTTNTYNPTLRKWTLATPLGKTFNYSLDINERITQAQLGALLPTNYTYTNEHLTGILQGTRATTLVYSSTTGLLESITDSLNQTTSFDYDANERISSIERPDANIVLFSYNSVGQLASITPAGKPNHSFSYDLSELVSSNSPSPLTGVPLPQTSYTYEANKIKTITRPDGKIITYNYNPASALLTSVVSNEATINITRDVNNLPSYLSSANRLGVRMTYQGRFPLTEQTEEQNSTTIAYRYGRTIALATGRLTTDWIVDKFSTGYTIGYDYNNDEKLSVAGDMTYNYYAGNGLLDTAVSGASANQVGKNVYTTYGELSTQTTTVSATQVHKLTLTYDGSGRIQTKKDDISGTTTPNYNYTYDNLGRLTTVKDGTIVIGDYTYDENGNRLTSVTSLGSVNYIYDNQDRLTDAGVYTFTYNSFGERSSKTNTLTSETTIYTYDSFGNLTQVQMPNGDVISYEIDAKNRRVGKKKNGALVSRYVYMMDGLRIIAELSPTQNLKRTFIYGSKSNIPDYYIESGVKYRIVSDNLGSPRLVFNISTGAVVAIFNHDEFGNIKILTNPALKLPFGFAGGLYDVDTGLTLFGARSYDPEVGRWLSKDPILFSGGDTNLYGYVQNDPVNWIDPTGLARGDWWDPRTYILPVVEAGQGATDFARNYGNMRQANTIGADKYFHCMANCQSSQRGPGGQSAAVGISEGREFFDQYIKGDSANACNADRAANAQGQSGAAGGACSQVCGSLRPVGLGSQW